MVIHNLRVACLSVGNDDADVEVVQRTGELRSTLVHTFEDSRIGEVEALVVGLALTLDLLALVFEVKLVESLARLELRGGIYRTSSHKRLGKVRLYEKVGDV